MTTDLQQEVAISAFVGSKYFTYYKNKWAKQSSWNWAAFFAGPFWLVYRKMYLGGWLYLLFVAIVTGVEVFGPKDSKSIAETIGGLMPFVGPAVIASKANPLYKEHVAKQISETPGTDLRRLAKTGGTSIAAVFLLLCGFAALVVGLAVLSNGVT
jgi:uncharacterized membrane protein